MDDIHLDDPRKFSAKQIKVEILNINNGERFQTYAIKGKRGSKCFCLNGAAARKAQPGDKIIIVTYAQLNEQEIKNHKPTIVQVGENNEIVGKSI